MGILVLFFGFPYVFINLELVVAIEAFMLHHLLHKTADPKRLWKAVFVANLVTTLVGYPIAAALMGLFPFIGLNIGWLVPFENVQEMTSYIAISLILTLIPAYFLSVWIEGKIIRKRFPEREITLKVIFLTNLASYTLLSAEAFIVNPLKLLKYFSL